MFNFKKKKESTQVVSTQEVKDEFTPEEDTPQKDIQAATELVRLGFNTPDNKMSQMTVLSARMAYLLSFSETMDYIASKDYIIGSASRYWRMSYYRHQRAVAGETFGKLVDLAHTQLGIQKEEATQGDMTKW